MGFKLLILHGYSLKRGRNYCLTGCCKQYTPTRSHQCRIRSSPTLFAAWEKQRGAFLNHSEPAECIHSMEKGWEEGRDVMKGWVLVTRADAEGGHAFASAIFASQMDLLYFVRSPDTQMLSSFCWLQQEKCRKEHRLSEVSP
jgi:hypothetical protein